MELRQIAEVVVKKLNKSKGPVLFLIPTRGWSSLSEEGKALCDFAADEAFVARLKERLSPNVTLEIVDEVLNSTTFAKIAVS